VIVSCAFSTSFLSSGNKFAFAPKSRNFAAREKSPPAARMTQLLEQ